MTDKDKCICKDKELFDASVKNMVDRRNKELLEDIVKEMVEKKENEYIEFEQSVYWKLDYNLDDLKFLLRDIDVISLRGIKPADRAYFLEKCDEVDDHWTKKL